MPDKTGWGILFFMSYKKQFTQELTNTLLARHWLLDELTQTLQSCLGHSESPQEQLIGQLAAVIYHQFKDASLQQKTKQLPSFILENKYFGKIWSHYKIQKGRSLFIRNYTLQLTEAFPPLLACTVPLLNTTKDLSDWLALSPAQLEGYADTKGFERKSASSKQRHYHYVWKKKSIGAARLLEIPKSKLRKIQRKINTEILQQIPLHPACHGFRKDHSCLSYAQAHCAKPVVIRMDLQDFFSSVPLRRIHALFETVGYRSEVARLLAGLCTNQVPHSVLASNQQLTWRERNQYSTPHLPQGSPVSPALANLAAFKLDVRLAALMEEQGGSYTRYADDLAFSGRFSNSTIQRLHALVCHIVMNEGFSLNTRKTKIMHQGVRQSLTGLIVNQHVNYPRQKYDKLKAILFNCSRYGAKSQNRDNHANLDDFKAHLQGKIAYVKSINPQRAIKLERLFLKIHWD